MTEPDDFVLQDATQGPDGQPLNPAKWCPKCSRVLPLDAFKRYFTPAEAKYRGYTGNRKVLIETKHCEDCRPRRRTRPEAFKTYELRRKADRGEIDVVTFKAIAKTRADVELAVQTSAAVKRWDKVRIGTWQAALDALEQEFQCLYQQRRHARTRTLKTNPVLSQQVTAYVDGYLEILRRIRADLVIAKRKAQSRCPYTRWQDAASVAERDTVSRLWLTIPPNNASKMRPPGLFANADRDQPHYIPPPIPGNGPDPTPEEALRSSGSAPPREPIDWDNF